MPTPLMSPLTVLIACPSTGAAMAALYGASVMGAPTPVSVAASVTVFWLVAYRVTSLLEAIAAHRATRD
jgi:hypothetical protein